MIQFLKFVPVQLTFFLILGILVGNWISFQPIQLVEIFSFLLALFGVTYFWANKQFQPSLVFALLVFLISFFIGVSAITFKNQSNQKLHYANNLEFTTSEFILASIEIRKVLKSSAYYDKYEAEITQLNNQKSIGKILVLIQRDSIEKLLQVDDNLIVKAAFTEIQEPLNPFSFNYKKYLQKEQIHHQVHIYNRQFIIVPKTKKTIIGFAAKIRNKINSALIKYGFKNDELAVVDALLLGQKNAITSELLQSYAGAGAIHILAVSGLHVGIILLLLLFIFQPMHYFENGKLIATIIIVTLLWMYAILAGLSASVVRAVAMFTALTIGMQFQQRSNIYNTLVISMFFLLLFNPFYLFEVGFQLSYLAVFSIVWIQPKLYSLWTPTFWLPTKFWQLTTVSVAAQIGVLPLSLYYFHQFPGLFFLSNLVIIPFLGILLTVGIIVIFLAVFGMLPQFLADSFNYFIEQMNGFVDWISHQEFFIIQHISLSLGLMLASYGFLFIAIKWIEKKVYYRFVLLLFSMVLIQTIFIFEKHKVQSTNEFVVFNKSNSSIIGIRFGERLIVGTSDSLSQKEYTIKPYLIGVGIQNKFQTAKSKNLYKFKNEVILIIDSLGIYNFKAIKPTIIVLQQSPKINLERLLKLYRPKVLIADGSNYKSYVTKWEQTCIKNKNPFHNTMQKGAFVIN